MNHKPLPLGAAQPCLQDAPGGLWVVPSSPAPKPRELLGAVVGCFVCGKPSWSRAGAGERPRRAKSAWMRPPGTWQQPVAVQPQGLARATSSEMGFLAPDVPQVVTCAALPDLGLALWGQQPLQPLRCCAGAAQQAALWGVGFCQVSPILSSLSCSQHCQFKKKKRPFIILSLFLGAGAGQAALPVPHPLLTAQLP